MIDLFVVAYTFSPLIFLIFEKPFGLISRVRGYFDSLYVIREGFTLYNLFSFFFILGLWIFFLAPLPQILANGNLVTEYFLNGHWLSWVVLLIPVSRYGYFDLLKGIYSGAFVYAAHELIWIVADMSFYLPSALAIAEHYAVIIGVTSFFLLGYFAAWRGMSSRKEKLIVATIFVWDIMWLLAGFHVSVNNFLPNPKTEFFSSQIVNLSEVMSWVIPCVEAAL